MSNELKDIACNLCFRRDGCMPYNDTQLVEGADGGHVPLMGECNYFTSGNQKSKDNALENLSEFNDYAKKLVSVFNKGDKE